MDKDCSGEGGALSLGHSGGQRMDEGEARGGQRMDEGEARGLFTCLCISTKTSPLQGDRIY